MAEVRRGWAIGVIAVAVIGAAGWITLVKVRTLDAAAGWVRHSQDVRLALERSLSTLKDTETCSRGYTVTRSEVFLPSFQASLQAARRSPSPISTSSFTTTPSRPRARASSSGSCAFGSLPLQGAVQIAQAGGPERDREEALRVQLEGNARMEAVRAQARTMHAEEERLLQSRLQDSEQARQTAIITAGLTTLLAAPPRRDDPGARKTRLPEAARERGMAVDHAAKHRRCRHRHGQSGLREVPEPRRHRAHRMVHGRRPHPRRLDEVFNIISGRDAADCRKPCRPRAARRRRRRASPITRCSFDATARSFPIEDSGAPIKDNNGDIHGVVLVFKDASEQRAAEARLTASEERLRLAIEVAGLGTWDRDLATGELIWNEQLYRMMGFAPNTPLTREIARSVVARRRCRDGARRPTGARWKSRTPYQLEYRIRRADDGQERWVAVLGRYIYDEEGRTDPRTGHRHRHHRAPSPRTARASDAEARCAGHAGRRHRARLQQHPVDPARQPAADRSGPAAGSSDRAGNRRDESRVLACTRSGAADPHVRAAAGAGSQSHLAGGGDPGSASPAALDCAGEHPDSQPLRGRTCRPCSRTPARSIRSS